MTAFRQIESNVHVPLLGRESPAEELRSESGAVFPPALTRERDRRCPLITPDLSLLVMSLNNVCAGGRIFQR
jgi:hypothetical protein